MQRARAEWIFVKVVTDEPGLIGCLEQENEVLRRAAAYLSQANLPGK